MILLKHNFFFFSGIGIFLIVVTDGNHKRMPCAGLKQIHTGIYSITQYLLKQNKTKQKKVRV